MVILICIAMMIAGIAQRPAFNIIRILTVSCLWSAYGAGYLYWWINCMHNPIYQIIVMVILYNGIFRAMAYGYAHLSEGTVSEVYDEMKVHLQLLHVDPELYIMKFSTYFKYDWYVADREKLQAKWVNDGKNVADFEEHARKHYIMLMYMGFLIHGIIMIGFMCAYFWIIKWLLFEMNIVTYCSFAHDYH